MPLSAHGCSSGLLATALVTLLLLPSPYFVPELYAPAARPRPAPPASTALAPLAPPAWFDFALDHFPPLDLFFTAVLLVMGLFTYLCEWIQRKVMERRIFKLNVRLGASVARLRAWDAQQEQLEATLRLVRSATAEYNLLLYLLLRRHRCLAAHSGPPSKCFFEKDLDEDLAFLRNTALDA